MKRIFKWTGIVLLVLIVIMMVYAIIGKGEVLKLNIGAVDLKQISDGSYVGSYDNFRWSNKVEVTVKEHKIIGIKPVKIQSGRDDMVKKLTKRVIEQQSPAVDAISGATASSKGFLRAVEMALRNTK